MSAGLRTAAWAELLLGCPLLGRSAEESSILRRGGLAGIGDKKDDWLAAALSPVALAGLNSSLRRLAEECSGNFRAESPTAKPVASEGVSGNA